jgi:predicted GNAT family N-acyltransferase
MQISTEREKNVGMSLVQSIAPKETWAIRQQILRPFLPVSEMAYPQDETPGARHFGAFKNGKLVGIASVAREPSPGETDPNAWRLRGMATLPEVRGEGYGKALIQACITYLREQNASTLWCNARLIAENFYNALGFEAYGERFELPQIGPHVRMQLPLAEPSALPASSRK